MQLVSQGLGEVVPGALDDLDVDGGSLDGEARSGRAGDALAVETQAVTVGAGVCDDGDDRLVGHHQWPHGQRVWRDGRQHHAARGGLEYGPACAQVIGRAARGCAHD